jgi:hypothetical protein
MKEFILIFRGGDSERQQASPEQMQASMQRWQDWISDMAQKGQFVGGHPLTAEGKVLSGPGKKLTDGPFMEGKEIVGGYVIVQATDISEAVQMSESCPMLEAPSGTVEIREIGSMSAT